MDTEPRKPLPASRRDQLELRKRSFAKDEDAVAGPAVLGIIIGGVLGAWLVFMLNNMIEGQANSNHDSCATWYTGDATGIAECKGRWKNDLMIWSIGAFILILTGVGIAGLVAHKSGSASFGSAFGSSAGTIIMGAVGTWLVFMLGGMVESQNATTRANCETWYPVATEAADHASCKQRAADKMGIFTVAQFILILLACGLGAVGGHFGPSAVRAYRGRRGRGGGGGGSRRGRPRGI